MISRTCRTLRTRRVVMACAMVFLLVPSALAGPPIYNVSVPAHSPVRGNSAGALITIVQFSEFQCPFCGRVNPTLKKVLDRYPGLVRIVYRHNPLPFHKNAMISARASMAAARQGRFWEMHDELFANQRALGEDNLFGYASGLGLDMIRFKADFRSPEIEKQIEKDMAEAVRLGARGVPAFFINGRHLSGARPFDGFAELIDELLPEARRAGGSGDELYARLTANGVTEKPPRNPSARRPTRPGEDPDKVHPVQADNSYWIGTPGARVEIILFSDYQCPYCKRISATLAEVLKAYPGKVRLVLKHNPLPFHKDAQLAAEAALAAGAQGRFREMHDKLFENMRKLKREDLDRYAKDLGLDTYRFRQALDTGNHKPEVERDKAQAAELGARGTPTCFINGLKLVGAQPLDRFKEKIDQVLGGR